MYERLELPISGSSPVRAVFSSRVGGVSQHPFDSMNLAQHVGDRSEDVIDNRNRIVDELMLPSSPRWLNQVHSDIVLEFSASDSRATIDKLDPLTADGCFTRSPGIVLGILVADCLPVLLVSKESPEVAALHVGWKGLTNGILKEGVARFRSRSIVAWIGPHIGQCHYEVGTDLKDKFPRRHLIPGRDSQHWMLDLAGVATDQLESLGVVDIIQQGKCTFCHTEEYYSFRRVERTGRMAALVWIEPS
jgi:YfiH family protein